MATEIDTPADEIRDRHLYRRVGKPTEMAHQIELLRGALECERKARQDLLDGIRDATFADKDAKIKAHQSAGILMLCALGISITTNVLLAYTIVRAW